MELKHQAKTLFWFFRGKKLYVQPNYNKLKCHENLNTTKMFTLFVHTCPTLTFHVCVYVHILFLSSLSLFLSLSYNCHNITIYLSSCLVSNNPSEPKYGDDHSTLAPSCLCIIQSSLLFIAASETHFTLLIISYIPKPVPLRVDRWGLNTAHRKPTQNRQPEAPGTHGLSVLATKSTDTEITVHVHQIRKIYFLNYTC